MALIDIVKKAQSLGPAHNEAAGLCGLEPAWLADIEQPQEPENVDLLKWQPVPAVLDSVNLKIQKELKLVEELSQIPDKEISYTVLDQRLRPYLEQVLDSAPNPNSNNNANSAKRPNSKALGLNKLLRKAAPVIGQKLLSWIIKAVTLSRLWDIVKSLLEAHLVNGNSYPELVCALTEQDQTYLLCVWLKNIEDPRFSDVLLVLKYLLKSTWRSAKPLAAIRNEWKKFALDAINKLSKKMDKSTPQAKSKEMDVSMSLDVNNATPINKSIAQENDIAKAVLLAVGFDQFHPFELCLHYILMKRLDEAVLASIISELNGTEVFKLLRYLNKWLAKYSKHSALSTVKNVAAKETLVPSLQEVLQWVSVVLDTHLMTLLLCTDFHQELESIQSSISGMVSLSRSFAPLAGILEHLRANGPLPKKPSSHGEDDHIIEYLEI